ncbi:ROK family protein [Pseudolysinimonas sp.]
MTAPTRSTLALDIGGTKLAVGVVAPDGSVHGLRVIPTDKHEGPDAVLARLFAAGHLAIAEAGHDVGAVGISCGGPLDADTGVVMRPLNLPDWDDVPVGPLAAREFGVPAHLVNDATAGMLGEAASGAAVGARNAIYLTLSTGVGGGAVLNGLPHRGAAGNGGEFGHVMVRPFGRRCTCGRLGCLEAYASGTSIAARARDAVASATEPTVLAALDTVRAEDVVAAADAGDPLARRIWDETLDVIGQAVTDLVNTFEPDVVVLGGGVTRSGGELFDRVRRTIDATAMAPAAAAVRLERAALAPYECLVGAAVHAVTRIEETTHV